MTTTRYRWDKELDIWIDLWDDTRNYPEPEKLVGPSNLIKDIDNYVAVGIQDHHAPRGTPLVITKGRRQHRDELRSRGFSEVGNEYQPVAKNEPTPPAGPVIREALARHGFYDSARSIRELRRQGRS